MAAHLIIGLFGVAFGLALVVGAITNADWFARGALGRSGQAFWTEQEQAQVVKKIGHSMAYRVVMGTLGAGVACASVFWMLHG